MSDFTLTKDSDGIATITWDTIGKSMNVMSEQAFLDLDGLIDDALSDEAVKGIIITSGKEGSFAGGMDLKVIAKMRQAAGDAPAQGLMDGLMKMHGILRKIERAGMDPKTNKGGKPIACVLPGTALGIGFELPLSCHRIFAADNPRAKIGLPEIKVGIFPGMGGTTRLVRLLGAMAASPFLLQGKLSDPKSAKAAGLIHDVSEDPMKDARDWVLSEPKIVKPWDEKGYKMPGGAPYHPSGFMTYVGASAMIMCNTQGVYPAAKAILSAAYEGAQLSFDAAIKTEARWFTKVMLEPTATAMINTLFVNKEALEKGARRPEVPSEKVSKVGVLGAGMMGAGIAYVSANAEIDVVLLDVDQAAAERGKSYSEGLLEKGMKRGKVTAEKKAEVLGRITATTDIDALKGCDLIVEAVFEDIGVKAEITQKVEAVTDDSCIFASNTSTLPISELAKASKQPEQFIGIHFFSPVDKMLLVEIIRGKKTEDRAVAKALDFVRQIKKTPIVVNDERFFYANRCILPYINEGVRMASEGVQLPLIENAAKMLGFPLGPLQLVDEVSIDLGVKIATATKAAMGADYPDDAVDEVVFWMADQGRMGKKSNAGFYDYDDTGKRGLLWQGFLEEFPTSEAQPELDEVQHRLLMIQVLEAIRAYEAGVLEDIREGDVAAILGWGFAPWSGGPFSWVDRVGAAKVLEMCENLTATHGPRFAPPQMLKDLAANNAKFY